MNEPCGEPFSPAGLARRETMLDELVIKLRRTHRARRARRRLAAAAACAIFLIAVVRLARPDATDPTDGLPVAGTRLPAPALLPVDQGVGSQLRLTEFVHTDVGIVERCRARPGGRIVRMDDRTLLQTLAAIHRPAGLIRWGGRVQLTAPVTDAELDTDRINKRPVEHAGIRLAACFEASLYAGPGAS